MRIGLNLLHAQPGIGGGWNYIVNLVGGLGEHPGGHEFVAFVNPLSAAIVPTDPRFCTVSIPVRTASRAQRVLYENTRLPYLARRMGIDVLHWFANTRAPLSRIPSVVTIYDLLAFMPLPLYGRVKRTYLRLMVDYAIRTADLLLPISQSTADDVQARFGGSRDRLQVIPSVLPAHYRPASAKEVAAFKQAHGLPEEYWVYVAHFFGYKGHGTLVEAYRQVIGRRADRGWPLVLRGDGDEQVASACRAQVARAGLEDRVVFLPRLAETDMPALYTGAGALVFPSTYEGLGIPVLEALACGCPVVAASLPAVLESAGDALVRFAPGAVDGLADAMVAVAADPELRADLRLRGVERARLFRSEAVIPRLTGAYERAAAGARG